MKKNAGEQKKRSGVRAWKQPSHCLCGANATPLRRRTAELQGRWLRGVERAQECAGKTESSNQKGVRPDPLTQPTPPPRGSATLKRNLFPAHVFHPSLLPLLHIRVQPLPFQPSIHIVPPPTMGGHRPKHLKDEAEEGPVGVQRRLRLDLWSKKKPHNK